MHPDGCYKKGKTKQKPEAASRVNKCASRTPDVAPGLCFWTNKVANPQSGLPALFLIVFLVLLVLLQRLNLQERIYIGFDIFQFLALTLKSPILLIGSFFLHK